MTQAEQAVLLWPMLALAARTQQILSYAAVEGYTGIARHGLNRALGLIHDYCKQRLATSKYHCRQPTIRNARRGVSRGLEPFRDKS
jgi:hypothetical protein